MSQEDRDWFRDFKIDYDNGGLMKSVNGKSSIDSSFSFGSFKSGWYSLNSFNERTMTLFMSLFRSCLVDRKNNRVAFFRTRWFEIYKPLWWKELPVLLSYRKWLKFLFVIVLSGIIYLFYFLRVILFPLGY